MITIRKATPQDREDILRLFLILVAVEDDVLKTTSSKLMKTRVRKKTHIALAREEILKNMRQKNSLFIVAVHDNQVVGYGFGGFEFKNGILFESQRKGYVYTIVVQQEFRGQGIATKLHDELYNWLKKKGCDLVFIGLFAKNPSHEIYKKWGYTDFNVDMVK